VPRPEMTLPLTPSALGLGPLRLNHTFSKPMLRRVLLKKEGDPSKLAAQTKKQIPRASRHLAGTGPRCLCSHRAMVFMGDKNVIPGAGVTACNDQCRVLAARCSPSPGAPAPVCASLRALVPCVCTSGPSSPHLRTPLAQPQPSTGGLT
jgi:hypothetical protein